MADDDPYVYPGTNVLRNHLGIRDAAELAELEAAISAGRIAQLERCLIPGDCDTRPSAGSPPLDLRGYISVGR